MHLAQHVLGVLPAAQQHRPLDGVDRAAARDRPARGVYASTTSATLRTSTGVPFVAFTTVLPMSTGERR
jgi:hypothetical protein